MTQNVQISKKLDDGTILVVGGDNYGDFAASLLELVGQDDFIDVIDLFKALVPGAAPAAPANNYSRTPPASTVPRSNGGTPPGQVAPECNHGPMQYKTGNGAKGPWKAWMCPAGPGNCQPEWIR